MKRMFFALFLPLLVSTNEFMNETQWASCNSYESCDECISSQFCHFCGTDYQCHAKFSSSGCSFGISCHNISECVRPLPYHIGYGFPSLGALVSCLSIVLSFVFALCACTLICSVYQKCCLKKNVLKKKCVDCQKYEPVGQCSGYEFNAVDPAALLDQHHKENYKFTDSISPETQAQILRKKRVISTKSSRKKLYCCWGILGFICISLSILVLMFFPKYPDYNICNRAFEWGSILTSITSLTTEITYKVALSVKNMNRLGFTIERANATIFHNNIPVGSWNQTEEWTAEPGSISDILIEIKITPGIGLEAVSLLNDFRSNQLYFRIDASIYGAISTRGYKIYHVGVETKDILFQVGAVTDRSLCPKECTFE